MEAVAWRPAPLGHGALRVLGVLHFLLSLVWTLGAVTATFRVYWFLSGALFFTHFTTAVLMLSAGLRWTFSVVLAPLRGYIVRRLRASVADAGAFDELAANHLVPWNPLITLGVAVGGGFGIPFLLAYGGLLIYAKYAVVPAVGLVAAPIARQLATELWTTDTGGLGFVLGLVVATLLLHIADLACALTMLAHYGYCCGGGGAAATYAPDNTDAADGGNDQQQIPLQGWRRVI